MSAVLVTILSVFVLGDAPFGATGTIQGVVVNGSQRGEPIADVDVQLRAGMHGVFESVAATKTDFYGKFVFENLPLESRIIYLPGANLAGVHYPGQRVRLEPNSRMVYVKIVAYDANLNVSPLEAKRHDIRIDFATNVLEVTESILISNPSRTTYVGQSRNDEPPITLRLSIPPHFDRVTFENEFYGRRFRIVDRGVDTDIPWPPGDTELQFTYRIASEASSGLFQRALDIPSSDVRIHVRPKEAQSVSCNLPKSTNNGDELLFAAVDKKLPAGFTIELQIGDAPVPWNGFARWGSLFMLAALVLATLLINRRRRRFGQQRRAEDPDNSAPIDRQHEAVFEIAPTAVTVAKRHCRQFCARVLSFPCHKHAPTRALLSEWSPNSHHEKHETWELIRHLPSLAPYDQLCVVPAP